MSDWKGSEYDLPGVGQNRLFVNTQGLLIEDGDLCLGGWDLLDTVGGDIFPTSDMPALQQESNDFQLLSDYHRSTCPLLKDGK